MTSPFNISAPQTDSELVDLYKKSSNQEVLASLYLKYSDLIYGLCLKYFKNPDDARDAVANIYEELIAKLLHHDVTYFRAWLYQLAKNHCLMAIRKKKINFISTDNEFVQLPDLSHLDDTHEKEVQFKIMQHCIEQLGNQQQIAIKLFYLKELCYKQISSISGLDLGTVKSHIQNGRRNLKNCMDQKLKST